MLKEYLYYFSIIVFSPNYCAYIIYLFCKYVKFNAFFANFSKIITILQPKLCGRIFLFVAKIRPCVVIAMARQS